MLLTVIIPVFNEENTIEKLLRNVSKANLPVGFKKEIIVIDDGSFDKTSKKLDRAKKNFKFSKNIGIKILRHKKNLGKGAAVKTGFLKASGEIIIIQDADLEYDPKYFIEFLEPMILSGFDVVYGTRLKNYPLKFWGKEKTPLPTHWIANKALTGLTNFLYKSSLTDMETCYKVFRRKVIESFELKSKRFDVEPELTAKILKKGFKIFEVPIKTNPRGQKEGKKIKWYDGLWAIWALIKYRISD